MSPSIERKKVPQRARQGKWTKAVKRMIHTNQRSAVRDKYGVYFQGFLEKSKRAALLCGTLLHSASGSSPVASQAKGVILLNIAGASKANFPNSPGMILHCACVRLPEKKKKKNCPCERALHDRMSEYGRALIHMTTGCAKNGLTNIYYYAREWSTTQQSHPLPKRQNPHYYTSETPCRCALLRLMEKADKNAVDISLAFFLSIPRVGKRTPSLSSFAPTEAVCPFPFTLPGGATIAISRKAHMVTKLIQYHSGGGGGLPQAHY